MSARAAHNVVHLHADYEPPKVRPIETRMESGYTRIYRRIWTHDSLYHPDDFVRIAMWARLISLAAYNPKHPTSFRVCGQEVFVNRGQIAISAEEWGRQCGGQSRKIVRSWLDGLINANRIKTTVLYGHEVVRSGPDAGQTRASRRPIGILITICNYDAYQAGSDDQGHARANQGPTTGQHSLKKERKNEGRQETPRSDSESPASSPKPEPNVEPGRASADADAPDPPVSRKSKEPRGSRLSPDWVPSQELLRYAVRCGIPADRVRPVFDQFQNHWLAKPGAAARKLDWDRTWQNWVSREGERYQKQRPSTYQARAPQTEHWGLT